MKKLLTISLLISTGITFSEQSESNVIETQSLSASADFYTSIFPTKPPRPKRYIETINEVGIEKSDLKVENAFASIFPTKPPRPEKTEVQFKSFETDSHIVSEASYASIFPTKPPRKKTTLA